MTRATLPLLLLVSLSLGALADEPTPAEIVKEAGDLLERGRYEESLALWRKLIEDHAKDDFVLEGSAHWRASRCLRFLGKPREAAELLESYLARFPNGDGVFAALYGIFFAYAEAGEEKLSRKAGKLVFKEYPDGKDTFRVLRAWTERGWKVPRLKTPFRVLYDWTFDRIDGARDPDLRLAFLDVIEAQYRNEDFVKDGSILFCQAWCHVQAGRPEVGLELGEKHLKFFPKDPNRDKVRVLMARAMLGLVPPQTDRARKLLRAVIANPETRYRKQAEELLGLEPKDTSIQIDRGCPRPEGLSRIAVLTNLSPGSALFKATAAWRKARDAEVVPFRGGDVSSAAGALRRLGFEYVAVLVAPETLDSNFHLDVLELCRGLDEDAMPDFRFGYLTARDGEDLEAMLARILEKEEAGGTAAKVVGLPNSGGEIAGLDFFLHFGHGTARRIVGGLDAARVAALTLERGPVVFSGACFNGVCSRSFESSIMDVAFRRPEEIPPAEVLSLAWIHAGATGVVAALDGDRGEMAMAEWEYFRERAPTLGEVVGEDYRLAFTSLPEDYEGFPRYRPGTAKRTRFYDVMLRGLTSRILLSDPMYRPLRAPLAEPTTRSSAQRVGEAIVVEVEVARFASGPFINVLPTRAGIPFSETRLGARVLLPEGTEGRLGRPEIELAGKASGAALTRERIRHEVWGGRRYVNVQLESGSGKLATPGARARFTFGVRHDR